MNRARGKQDTVVVLLSCSRLKDCSTVLLIIRQWNRPRILETVPASWEPSPQLGNRPRVLGTVCPDHRCAVLMSEPPPSLGNRPHVLGTVPASSSRFCVFQPFLRNTYRSSATNAYPIDRYTRRNTAKKRNTPFEPIASKSKK